MSKIKSVNDLIISYEENTDNFIKDLEYDTEDTLKKFISFRSFLSCDKFCKTNMGKENLSDIDLITRKEFSCKFCKNAYRLFSIFEKKSINNINTINIDNFRNKYIRITEYPSIKLEYFSTDNKYYGLDKISNKLVTSLLANSYQENRDLTNLCKIYDSSRCGKNIYVMHETLHEQNFNIKKYLKSPDNIKSIIFQYFAYLDSLKDSKYDHGNSSVSRIFISQQEKESKKIYKNNSLITDFTLKILPSSKSSINLKNKKRIMNSIHISTYDYIKDKDIFYENDDCMILSEFLTYNNYEHAKSFDLYPDICSMNAYSFIISLFSQIETQESCDKDSSLLNLYKYITYNSQLPDMELNTEKDTYDYIVNKQIRKNMTEDVLSKWKKIF